MQKQIFYSFKIQNLDYHDSWPRETYIIIWTLYSKLLSTIEALNQGWQIFLTQHTKNYMIFSLRIIKLCYV